MMTVADINQNEENYVWWLTIMPDELMRLQQLPRQLRESLDFSPASLDVLEGFILDNYTVDELDSAKFKYARDLYARYIGETFRKNVPNTFWTCDLEDKNNIYYGIPVLKVKDLFAPPIAAPMLVFTLIHRNKNNFLSSYLEMLMEKTSGK